MGSSHGLRIALTVGDMMGNIIEWTQSLRTLSIRRQMVAEPGRRRKRVPGTYPGKEGFRGLLNVSARIK
jgi:formylglycine-generating enzyme required for sulfatase activity